MITFSKKARRLKWLAYSFLIASVIWFAISVVISFMSEDTTLLATHIVTIFGTFALFTYKRNTEGKELNAILLKEIAEFKRCKAQFYELLASYRSLSSDPKYMAKINELEFMAGLLFKITGTMLKISLSSSLEFPDISMPGVSLGQWRKDFDVLHFSLQEIANDPRVVVNQQVH